MKRIFVLDTDRETQALLRSALTLEGLEVVCHEQLPLDPTRPALTNPFGCLPNGRIMATTVTLGAGSQANVRAEFGSAAGKVEFSCTNQASAAGKLYKLFAAVDTHADDINLSDKTLGPCPEFGSDDSSCGQALADDDLDSDNRDDRLAPRVRPP